MDNTENWQRVRYRGELLYGYEVSDLGCVRTVVGGRILGHINNGRPMVSLYVAGYGYNEAIANLVAQTWLQAPHGVRVRYRDGDRRNVRAGNLEV